MQHCGRGKEKYHAAFSQVSSEQLDDLHQRVSRTGFFGYYRAETVTVLVFC